VQTSLGMPVKQSLFSLFRGYFNSKKEMVGVLL
jgi:hypothetical protein